jgi:hypothetical protein
MTDCARLSHGTTLKTEKNGTPEGRQNAVGRFGGNNMRPPGSRLASKPANGQLMGNPQDVKPEFRLRTLAGLELGSVFTWFELERGVKA